MSRRTRKNVGVIGLGIIGTRVRDLLRRKGFHVFVWNRTPRPVPNFVGAPSELAEMCDYVQIFVSDDEALLHVVRQLSPGLSARHVVLAHSTVAPHTMVAAAEIVERRGARFVEAPFTGSKEAAEKGELVYYAGGDEAAVKEARPILEVSGKEIIEFGEVGQATAIKIATNMITAATVQAAAEALALLHMCGLPIEKFATAMQQNGSNSKTLSMKLPKMVAGDFEPHFSVKHMLKDMQIASRLGLSHHLELAVSSAARDRLLEQLQRGYGEEDYCSIIRKYFPDIGPNGGSVAGLELFEASAAAAEHAAPAPVPESGNEPPVESVPVNPASQVAIPDLAPMSADLRPDLVTAEPALQQPVEGSNGGSAPAEETEMLAEPEAEEEEATPRPRGFLSRLLRRTDY